MGRVQVSINKQGQDNSLLEEIVEEVTSIRETGLIEESVKIPEILIQSITPTVVADDGYTPHYSLDESTGILTGGGYYSGDAYNTWKYPIDLVYPYSTDVDTEIVVKIRRSNYYNSSEVPIFLYKRIDLIWDSSNYLKVYSSATNGFIGSYQTNYNTWYYVKMTWDSSQNQDILISTDGTNYTSIAGVFNQGSAASITTMKTYDMYLLRSGSDPYRYSPYTEMDLTESYVKVNGSKTFFNFIQQSDGTKYTGEC